MYLFRNAILIRSLCVPRPITSGAEWCDLVWCCGMGQVTLINKTVHHTIHLNYVLATQMFYLLHLPLNQYPCCPIHNSHTLACWKAVRHASVNVADNTQKHMEVTHQSLPTASHVAFNLRFSCTTTNATHYNYCTEQISFVYTMWTKKKAKKWGNT